MFYVHSVPYEKPVTVFYKIILEFLMVVYFFIFNICFFTCISRIYGVISIV
jgi:hypothetical protein